MWPEPARRGAAGNLKVALVSASLVAVLAHLPVPFAPAQIILMELFMDIGASVTFTTEPAEGDVEVWKLARWGHS